MEREMDINGPYHYTDPWTNDKIAPYTNNILNKGNKKKRYWAGDKNKSTPEERYAPAS